MGVRVFLSVLAAQLLGVCFAAREWSQQVTQLCRVFWVHNLWRAGSPTLAGATWLVAPRSCHLRVIAASAPSAPSSPSAWYLIEPRLALRQSAHIATLTGEHVYHRFVRGPGCHRMHVTAILLSTSRQQISTAFVVGRRLA